MGQQKSPTPVRRGRALPTCRKKPRSRMRVTTAAPTIGRPWRRRRRTSISARSGELRARRSARAAERRHDLPERRGAARCAAAAGGAARRSHRRALSRGRARRSRRCTTAPGRWRRSKSCWRSCDPRAKAATSCSAIKSACHETRPSPSTQTILRHWREAVPDDRLAHLVKDATRALVRALQMRLAEHGVSFGHWTFLRILWEGDGLTQRELSEQAGVMEPTTFSALKAMERLGYITPQAAAAATARRSTSCSRRRGAAA